MRFSVLRGIMLAGSFIFCSFLIGFSLSPELTYQHSHSRLKKAISRHADIKDVGIQPSFNALQIINAEKRRTEPPPDCAKAACIALTFDDGPAPETVRILDVLDRYGAAATFYLVGNKVSHYSAIVKRMAVSGYEVGNHSWSHPDFRKLTPEEIVQQINLTQTAINEASAAAASFRPPYGFMNDAAKQLIPLPIIMWNTDPKDWRETNPELIANHILSQARAGSIILLHATKAHTADALERSLGQLKSRFQLVTVSQLLNLTPYSRGYFYSR